MGRQIRPAACIAIGIGPGRRFRSHDLGTVGLLKQLIVEHGAYDATSAAIEGEQSRSSRFHHMLIVTPMAFIWKAPWVATRHDSGDKLFPRYPDESIASWHERLGLVDG